MGVTREAASFHRRIQSSNGVYPSTGEEGGDMGEDSHEITSRREFRESRKQFREILIIKPETFES